MEPNLRQYMKNIFDLSEMTQQELSDRMGVSRPTVVNTLKGKNKITKNFRDKFAKVFKIKQEFMDKLAMVELNEYEIKIGLSYEAYKQKILTNIDIKIEKLQKLKQTIEEQEYGFSKNGSPV